MDFSLVCTIWMISISLVFQNAHFEECGGDLKVEETEFITSPGYPRSAAEKTSTYPPNLDCIWKHNGEDDTLIAMKFLDSIVEAGENGSNVTCDFDYVEINITSIEGRKYCGYKKHPDAIVGLGSVTIHFHTDRSGNYRGFKLAYKITLNFDPCEKSVCQQGVCVSDDGIKARCACEPGFTGNICETDISECESEPCQNGGTCDDSTLVDHYSCHCSFEYYGENCEKAKVPACDEKPCKNGATCIDLPGFEYECECKEFFDGVDCEIETGCISPGLPKIEPSKRFHLGTKLQFSCKDGFEMNGENETECMDDNSWSKPVPECKDNDSDEDKEKEETKSISQSFIVFISILVTIFVLFSIIYTVWMILRGPWMKIKDPVKIFEEDIEVCTITRSDHIPSDEFFSVKED